jgi:hypothetical protein
VSAELEPVISAKALEKSGRVLKALSLLYFPFHGLELIDLFEHYGVFAFVSAVVYQVDELNELHEDTMAPSLDKLRSFLLHRSLLDDQTSRYIHEGELYLAFERHFRRAGPKDFQEIMTAMEWRSSDFRILHCLLHRFLSRPYDSIVFGSFAHLELLMELDDDTMSYEEDVKSNTFNFLRALTMLPTLNPSEAVKNLRSHILQQIDNYKGLMSADAAARFEHTVNIYFTLVPEPRIPTSLN